MEVIEKFDQHIMSYNSQQQNHGKKSKQRGSFKGFTGTSSPDQSSNQAKAKKKPKKKLQKHKTQMINITPIRGKEPPPKPAQKSQSNSYLSLQSLSNNNDPPPEPNPFQRSATFFNTVDLRPARTIEKNAIFDNEVQASYGIKDDVFHRNLNQTMVYGGLGMDYVKREKLTSQ